MKSEYYVYVYLREKDSEIAAAGTPYYVGKGKGRRITAKHRVSIPNDSSRIVIVSENLDEQTALTKEMELISKYGRVDLGTGILRNLTDGGDQPPDWTGKKHKDDTRQTLREFRVGKTYEELMGEEKAREVRRKKSDDWMGQEAFNKGKKIEEYMGEDRALAHKQHLRELNEGSKNPFFGKQHTQEQRDRKSKEKQEAPLLECPHCHEMVDHMNYGRWHGDNCKVVASRKPRERKECPHCKGMFAVNTIGQHMNKCKEKK